MSIFENTENMCSYSKWTPGSPCELFFPWKFPTKFIITFTACTGDSSCSSSKVAGLIFYETFSFLWTSQVIGNVALATLAGGPYGCWYYFGPSQLGEMVRSRL